MRVDQTWHMPPRTGKEACTMHDGFFLDDYKPHRAEVTAAITLCRRCPVVRICLIWALANPTMAYDGIWGATTPGQRKALRHALLHRLGPEKMTQTLRAEYDKTLAQLPKVE